MVQQLDIITVVVEMSNSLGNSVHRINFDMEDDNNLSRGVRSRVVLITNKGKIQGCLKIRHAHTIGQ